MLATGKNDLICDLAETYHIYDYRALPASMVAILAVGLREDSRIKMKMNDMRYPLDIMLTSLLVDRMSLFVWMNTEDGVKGENRPVSVFEQLLGKKKDTDILAFDSPDDFEAAKAKILKRGES